MSIFFCVGIRCAADNYNHNILDLKSAAGQGGKVLRGVLAIIRGERRGGLPGDGNTSEGCGEGK